MNTKERKKVNELNVRFISRTRFCLMNVIKWISFLFQSWELHIKFVKPSDEGIYECQISTHPPSSIFVHLRVVGKFSLLHKFLITLSLSKMYGRKYFQNFSWNDNDIYSLLSGNKLCYGNELLCVVVVMNEWVV